MLRIGRQGVGSDLADFRSGAFRLFFTSRTVSMVGDMMRPIVMVAAVLEAGYGVSGAGYALAAEMVPYAMFVLLGGALADRYTPRRMMISADVLRLVTMGTLAASFAFGQPQLWHILALLALTGLGAAAFQPGVASVIPQIAPDVQRGNAVLRVSESAMTVIGPAVAGLLLAFTDAWVVILLDAVTFAVSALCLSRLRLGKSGLSETPLIRGLAEGWREFRSRQWLWGTIVVWMCGGLLSRGPSQTLGASLITSERSASIYGLIMAVFGVGHMVGGLLALRVQPRRPLVTGAVATATFALSPLAVALGLPTPITAFGYFIHGAGATFWLVMWHSTIQTQVPREALSRVHAYDVAGSRAVTPVGQALAGPVGEHMGLQTVLFAAAAFGAMVPAALLSIPGIRQLRRREATSGTT
ncbi:MFS transporter [Nonomuraea sp. NPDC046802]|uniref:MFS transporter n=1 Tax=Nonomuraea sp. NPDC046802 TaxID=3154919 RepID=UPI0033CD7FEF